MGPIRLAGAAALTGGIRGVVLENTGRPLGAGARVQLVNSRGIAVTGKNALVSTDGGYAFADVDPGVYTVQVVGGTAMTVVNVVAGKVSLANVTVAAAPQAKAGMSTTTKWLIALAAIGGGTAVGVWAANRNDASGSQ